MAQSPAPPPPSQAPPPPPAPTGPTSYKQALDDLMNLTDPASHVYRATHLTNSIGGLIQQTLEILSLSRSQANPLAMYDLINLGVLRNRLLFRNVSLTVIDELIRHHISRIPQAIQNSGTRLGARDLEDTLGARTFLAAGVHIDVGDLDRAVLDMVQKMKADAAEVITVS